MIEEFFKDVDNYPKLRYVGFTMGAVGMLVTIVAAIVATATGFAGLGFCAGGMGLLSFSLFPITDLNFPKRRGW
jgi:hypothetical protein